MKGRVLLASLVLASAAAGALAASPGQTRAATPSLTLVTAATYDVLPAKAVVAVTVQITATNHLTNTITKAYFFHSAYLAVLPGTTGFSLSASSGKPSVGVVARKSAYTLLKLTFTKPLPAGASTRLTLRFTLRDPGGVPERPLRISPSVVAFTAWAYATPSTPGSSVTVTFPAGYNVTIGRGPLSGPTMNAQGRAVWSSGPLASPLTFIADITADRPADYVDDQRQVMVGDRQASLDVQGWRDDPAWRTRVGDLVVRSFPALGGAIGVPWPIDGTLTIQEALVRSTGGYAGLFDPTQRRIQVSYTAPPGVVLHEAAHAWFNGRLVADRWVAEAFASYYAEVVASQLKIKVSSPQQTKASLAAAIPLNAWGPVGSTSSASETYAYAASLALAESIASRAGPEALRRVWSSAAQGIGAYQPTAGGAEPLGGPPDWRGLLDLLEDTTGTAFDDLWRQVVARPQDLPLLDARAAARLEYADTVRLAGSWTLPRSIRDAMRAWQFDVATQAMGAAQAVLRQRAALDADAAAAGLSLPAALEMAFEGAGGLAAAAAEANAEEATIAAIREAAASRPPPDGVAGVVDAVGLIGSDPRARLGTASNDFTAGRLADAIADASAAEDAWMQAGDLGRARILSIGLLEIALVLLVGTVLQRRRRPRVSRA